MYNLYNMQIQLMPSLAQQNEIDITQHENIHESQIDSTNNKEDSKTKMKDSCTERQPHSSEIEREEHMGEP